MKLRAVNTEINNFQILFNSPDKSKRKLEFCMNLKTIQSLKTAFIFITRINIIFTELKYTLAHNSLFGKQEKTFKG